jgi:hypothetical protein
MKSKVGGTYERKIDKGKAEEGKKWNNKGGKKGKLKGESQGKKERRSENKGRGKEWEEQ